MICFKDKTFCTAAPYCGERHTCDRYLTPELKEQADAWAEGLLYTPIAYSDFSEDCKWFRDERHEGST